jgi:hypothetical protein
VGQGTAFQAQLVESLTLQNKITKNGLTDWQKMGGLRLLVLPNFGPVAEYFLSKVLQQLLVHLNLVVFSK